MSAPGSSPSPSERVRLAAELRSRIEAAATILVASEPLPDGDAIGSELSLRHAIAGTFGLATTPGAARPGPGPKHVCLLSELGVSARYRFLEGAESVRAPTDSDRTTSFDLGILVDGGVERCGDQVRAIFLACRTKVMVDHHQTGSRARYDLSIVDPHAAATTELLADLFATPAWSDLRLERPLAEALYTGLIADTGSFTYSLTTPRTHEIAARLLAAGARPTYVGERVLLETPLDDLRLQAKVLGSARVSHGGAIIAGALELADLDGRSPALVGYDRIVQPLSFCRGVRAMVLLREVAPSDWRISFRSRGDVDVAALARELDPGGGGHARAAGCSLRGELAPLRERLVAALAAKLGVSS